MKTKFDDDSLTPEKRKANVTDRRMDKVISRSLALLLKNESMAHICESDVIN